jgi:imidazolonepropionase-like amidohydrolase
VVIRSIFVLFLLSFCILASASGAENIAIRAGTVLTISGDSIENGIILIEDGKIKAIGQDVNIPEDARVIDASGKFAMPGLIDACSLLYVIEGELNESRSIAPELNILDAVDPFIDEYEEVLAQGVTSVYVAPGSRSLLGGRGAVLKLKGGKTPAEMLLKGDVAVKAAIGVSSNNQSSSLTRLEHYASIREAFIEAQAYMQQKRKYEQELAEYEKKKKEEEEKKKDEEKKDEGNKEKPKRPTKPKSNPTYEILIKVLAKEIPLQIEAHRVDDILNALRLADEFGTRLILDKCTEGYMAADEIARRKVPVIVSPVSVSHTDMPKLEYRNHNAQNAAILSKGGVKVALGVSGRDGASSKFAALAAAMAVANGMDRDTALRSITLTPAEILGVAHRIGSLEAGKDADIVILNGHPFDTSARVEMVLIEGKTVYGSELK